MIDGDLQLKEHFEDAMRESMQDTRRTSRNYNLLGTATIAAAVAIGIAATYAVGTAAMVGLGILSGVLGATGILTSGFAMMMEKKLNDEERDLSNFATTLANSPEMEKGLTMVANAVQKAGNKDWQQRVEQSATDLGQSR